jgi:hypothetical protein
MHCIFQGCFSDEGFHEHLLRLEYCIAKLVGFELTFPQRFLQTSDGQTKLLP